MKSSTYFRIVLVMLAGWYAMPCVSRAQEAASEAVTKTPPLVSKVQEASLGDEEKKALEARLEKYLTGTKWTGNFLSDGKDKMIKERYEILSAKKTEFGDKWNLVARIKYGDHDATIPLPPIEIKFAGKTPVITVDRVFFPGFGTFDARVVIRQGKYAGTWKYDSGGGHMFGNIEKMTEEEKAATKKLLKKIE